MMTPHNDSWVTYKKEIGAVAFFAVMLFLFLACISFNPLDRSLFYYSSQQTIVTNWCGAVGAHIAGFLFYLWGSVTYLFLAMLLVPAYMLMTNVSFAKEGDRYIALWGILVTSAILCRVYGFDVSNSVPGGLLGYFGTRAFYAIIGLTGTKVLVWSAWFIGVVWATKLSWSYYAYIAALAAKEAGLYAAGLTAYALKVAAYHIYEGVALVAAYAWRNLKQVPGLSVAGYYCIKQWIRPEPASLSREPLASHTGHVEISFAQEEGEEEPRAQRIVATDSRVVTRLGEYEVRVLANSVVSFDLIEKMKEVAQYESVAQESENNVAHSERNEKTSAQSETNAPPASSVAHNPSTSYNLPDLSLFAKRTDEELADAQLARECEERGEKLEEKLERFGVKGEVTAICPGPVITIFEYSPAIDTKISKIMALEDDLALALTALSIRIVAPIPGRNVVGFEISNKSRKSVLLADIMADDSFARSDKQLPIILGMDSTGTPVVEDLVKAPHLLVAGSTGSGKSVGLNAMLFSLLCKCKPDELRLILIDPKRLEFASYADIPHLLFPIVTNPRQAAPVLEWVVQEMEERYETMARAGVRNVFDYHDWYKKRVAASEQEDDSDFPNMPFIVVMIDELADLMMVAGKQVETHIARIAQMARAAGIHLIVATQRPSVDVLTGVIKVNFPSRVAYRVSSKIDSRTILDNPGAEKLLGRGDMLYLNSGSSDLQRVHGAYISDEEIAKLCDHLREQGMAQYLDLREVMASKAKSGGQEIEDELYDQVRELISTRDEISISMLQRHFRIGFNRSARLIEKLEMDGLVAPAQGSKPRKVLD